MNNDRVNYNKMESNHISVILRPYLGIESFHKFCKEVGNDASSYSELCYIYERYLREIYNKCESDFVSHLISICLLQCLPVCAEFGFIVDEQNYSHEYVSFFINKQYIDKLLEIFQENNEYKEYIVDAGWELEQRKIEKYAADFQCEYNIFVERGYTTITVNPPYYNCLIKKYPIEEIMQLHSDVHDDIANVYIYVQVCNVTIGHNETLEYVLGVVKRVLEDTE